MRIREAKIFNFGKLQNVHFRFDEGINVIYGENEHGKTTLHTFLTGMLFGMEKGRGRGAKEDAYSRYQPWQAPAFYSGALRFAVGGQPFYLERNFYAKERSEYLRNEADGEELSVEYGDLDMLLGGISKEEFGNTYDIPQSGAMTGRAMTELLTNYLAEAEAGSDGKIHVLQAGKDLAAKRRELQGRLRAMQDEREATLEKRTIQADILRENVVELREQILEFEGKQEGLAEDIEARELRRRKQCKVCGVGAGVMAAIAILLFAGKMIAAMVAGILTIAQLVMAAVLRRPIKDDALLHAQEMLDQMKEHLQEEENELLNLEEESQELKNPSIEEIELLENISALELARTELESLSEEYYLEVADDLNAEISKWISLLTKGTYDSARLGKDGKLWIVANHREVEPEALSRGTLEQIYLALRLAAGNVLMQEEEMPIFLDEAFAMYDDNRLKETLLALAKTGKQILIFTCQKREGELLEEANIPHHLIRM